MSENLKLSVNTGAMLIDIENEKGRKIGEFEFIPTDSNIVYRYESVVDYFNSVQIKDGLTDDETIEEMKKLSGEFREQINYLLGGKAADTIFQECGPLTIIANGDFFIENVLEGIGRLIEDVYKQRIQKKVNKIKKATGKYHA